MDKSGCGEQRDAILPERSGHIVELQSLRGLAASAVLFTHVVGYYPNPDWLVSIWKLADGRSAVVIFFVLSGYVLTRSMRSSAFDVQAVMRFYLQRCFRIYPAIWAASVLSLGYLALLHWNVPAENIGPGFAARFRTDRYDAIHVIASFAGMQAFLLPQLWSVFIEIIASIVLPGIAFVAFHRPRWMPLMLVLAAGISFAVPYSPYQICLYFMDFVVGAALAMHRLPVIAAAWLVPVCLIVRSTTLYLPFEYTSPTAHIIETLIAALMLSVLISTPVAWLRARFLKFVGDISYSIYLLHYVVMCVIGKIFAVMDLDLSIVVLTVTLAIFTYVVTIPLAWASYVWIEQPGSRLGKTILHRRLFPRGRLPVLETPRLPIEVEPKAAFPPRVSPEEA